MALSRNERRRIAKFRKNMALCERMNREAIEGRKAIVAANLSRPAKRECSAGLVQDYAPTRKPVSYTRPMRWTKGAANAGK